VTRDLDDDALMARTAQGEEAAFRLLVQRWEADVRAFLIHMLGSLEEAEDLTQDTFVKVFRQAGRYRPEGLFKSWLFRIAGNLARSRLRRRKIIGWLSFDPATHDVADTGPAPDEGIDTAARARSVRQALAGLPERQRQALTLHRYQGLKYREIAGVMDTTVPGVESLIQRALAALRRELAGKVEMS
jgi:RNA polymerase sigma-70 factor (ECF subfamily)